ncbi:hypothetical protein, partial [Trinickia symbiotica]|uniref:hypothetical protein n=1 Tax=Trinickia symbiotica TaxID=863227 RepID=UPI001CB9A369
AQGAEIKRRPGGRRKFGCGEAKYNIGKYLTIDIGNLIDLCYGGDRAPCGAECRGATEFPDLP